MCAATELRTELATAAGLGRLLTRIENDATERARVLRELPTPEKRAHRIGITGSPGVGKSTLLAKLVPLLISGGTGAFARGKSSTAPNSTVAQAPSPVFKDVASIPSSIEDFRIYRRDLPHWRMSLSTYWITWRLHNSHDHLPAEARDITEAAIRHLEGEQYKLVAYVVMDDHVHVIAEPLAGFALEKIVQAWKSVSAHRINKALGWTGPVWMPEYFDRIIRDEEELIEKCVYTLNNPKKRWLERDDYKWVYCSLLGNSMPSFATGDGARATSPGNKVAILAVDPSSEQSGGAVLGDRFRWNELPESVFVRSLASRGSMAGISAATDASARVLEAAGYDPILIETVGVGQTGFEVRNLADTVVVLLSPESGDALQLLKAGLIEAGDIFVVNKADRPGANALLTDLRAALETNDQSDWQPRVLAVSALNGDGIIQLAQEIDAHQQWRESHPRTMDHRHALEAAARSQFELQLAATLLDSTDLLERLNVGQIDLETAALALLARLPR